MHVMVGLKRKSHHFLPKWPKLWVTWSWIALVIGRRISTVRSLCRSSPQIRPDESSHYHAQKEDSAQEAVCPQVTQFRLKCQSGQSSQNDSKDLCRRVEEPGGSPFRLWVSDFSRKLKTHRKVARHKESVEANHEIIPFQSALCITTQVRISKWKVCFHLPKGREDDVHVCNVICIREGESVHHHSHKGEKVNHHCSFPAIKLGNGTWWVNGAERKASQEIQRIAFLDF